MKKLIALFLLAGLSCFAADRITIYDKSDDMIIGKLPVGEAVQEALDNVTINITTGAITQVIADGTEINVISGAAVKDALDSKVDSGSVISVDVFGDTIHGFICGQSNAKGAGTDGTNALTGELYTGITNTFLVSSDWIVGSPYFTNSIYTNIVYQSGTNSWSIEMQMSKSLRDLTGKSVYVTKATKSGSAITNFISTGVAWHSITGGLAAMEANWPASENVDFACWLQGESDMTTGSDATGYEANLRSFIASVRALPTVGATVPVFINSLEHITSGSYGGLVNEAFRKVAASDPYVFIVTNADIAVGSDGVHYNGAAKLLLGQRFADYVYAYFSNNATASRGTVNAQRVSGASVDAPVLNLNYRASLTDSLTPVSEHGLLAYIPMRGSFADVSTNAHTNVVTGTIDWQSDTFGQYPNFNATTSPVHVTVYSLPELTNNNFTLSIAIKRGFGVSPASTVMAVNLSSSISLTAGKSSADVYESILPIFAIKDSAGTSVNKTASYLLETNEFDYVAIVGTRNVTNSTFRYFVNGKQTYLWSPTNDFSVSSGGATVNLTIGGSATNTTVRSGLRDLTVYKRALDADEVRRLHAQQRLNRSGIRGIN